MQVKIEISRQKPHLLGAPARCERYHPCFATSIQARVLGQRRACCIAVSRNFHVSSSFPQCHGPGEMAPGIYAECIDVWIQNKGCDVQEIWTELSCCRNYTWRPARFLIVIPGVIASFEFYLYHCTVQEHLLNVYDFFSVYAVRHAHFSSRLCRACVMAPRPFVCIRGFLYGYVSAQRCC